MGLRALLPDTAVFVAPHVFAAFVGEVAAASVVGVSVDARIAGGNHTLHFYVKARGGGDDIGLFHDVCLCLIDKMMMRCCWAERSANDDLLAVDDVETLLGLLYAATTQVVGFHLVLLVRVDALDDRYLVRDEAHTGHLLPGGYGQIGAEAADVRAIELAEGYLTGRVVVYGILVPCGLQGVDGTLIRRFGDGLQRADEVGGAGEGGGAGSYLQETATFRYLATFDIFNHERRAGGDGLRILRQFQIAVVHLARIELQAAIVLSQIERRGERAVAVCFVDLDRKPCYLLNGPVAVVGFITTVSVHNGACLTTVVIEPL